MYKTVIAPESSVSASVSFLSTSLETLGSAIDQALLPHQHLLSSQRASQLPVAAEYYPSLSAAASNIKEPLCACISH